MSEDPYHLPTTPESMSSVPQTQQIGDVPAHPLSENSTLPPPSGLPVPTETLAELKRHELEQHGRDIKLGREIFALATDKEEGPVPVRFDPTYRMTDDKRRDIRDLASAAHTGKHLRAMAETSPVTGLPNRVVYNYLVEEMMQDKDRRDAAVAFVDLDGFKALNDAHGHDFGDEVLRMFGEALQLKLREGDVVVHFGGDEFAVVMPHFLHEWSDENLTPEERKVRMTERFREAANVVIQQIQEQKNKTIAFGASVGIGVYETGDTPESLTKKADEAMYEDKHIRKAQKQKDLGGLFGRLSPLRNKKQHTR